MILFLAQTFYLFLPAYFANMAPVIAGALKLPGGTPISPRLLGDHKTYRGIYAGYLGALLGLLLLLTFQKSDTFELVRVLDYTTVSLPLYAIYFGLGAIGGDALKSFAKRRIGIASGDPWPPFDQIDFILGTVLFLSLFGAVPSLGAYTAAALVMTPILHLGTNVVAYQLGLKKVWW